MHVPDIRLGPWPIFARALRPGPCPCLSAAGIPGAAVDEAEHIEKRRRGLETFMKRVARHPILSASRLFIRFLEIPSAVRRGRADPSPKARAGANRGPVRRETQSEVFQELGPAFHASAGVFTAANIPGLSLLTALVPKTVVRPRRNERWRRGLERRAENESWRRGLETRAREEGERRGWERKGEEGQG